jgi:diguanylate cyclase
MKALLVWPLLLLTLLCCSTGAGAQDALEVRADAPSIDAWPALRMLADPQAQLDAAGALQQLRHFERPQVPHANLGLRSGAVWLWLPLALPADLSGDWLLDVDYPSIDRIDVYALRAGRVLRQAALGDHVPAAQRALATRSLTWPLALASDRPDALLLRVQTTSTMIVPLRLVQADDYYASEMRTQLLQGLMTGIGLCLVLYSLANWVSVRDRIFLDYALSAAGATLFFFAYYGLGPQHLWGGSEWLTRNAAPFSVLLAVIGGCCFLDRALEVGRTHRRVSLCLRAAAGAAALAAALFALGLIDYRVASLSGTVLGPLPMLFGVPIAFIRSRGGDRAARYLLVGWAAYAVSVVTMALLLRGQVAANFVTTHAFQWGSIFEMTLWMLVLGVRVDELRRQAERTSAERDQLHSLALTDPLTGLPNRRGLQIAIEQMLPRCHARQLAAVYLLDLDGFKAINDRLGHAAGDALLIAVARRLQGCLRDTDQVARLGGDEFVVVAEALASEADAEAIGAKLLDAVESPFDVLGEPCRVGLTVGYAIAPLDGLDAASLLKRADAAMYAGKQAGRCQVRRGAASVGLVAA